MPDHTARICENGHILTVSLEENPDADDFCKTCGSKGIDHCQNCRAPINGIQPFWSNVYTKPQFCHKCGKTYPWIDNITESIGTKDAKWIRTTSLFYWSKFITGKMLKVFNWLGKHSWTRLEILTIVLILLALATLISMWMIYWR